MIAWFKRNWPYAIGGNIKTCSSGPQSLFSPAAPTFGAWSLYCPHSRVATTVELPVHLSVFPSEERFIETPGHEHQRSVRPGNTMAPCTSSGPAAIKAILASDRFQNRLHLWNLIHDLGSNTKARFNATRLLRSQEGGLHLCYALRRLATNIQEPYRTLSLQAIDSTIAWWKGKPAPRASALRAPWAMSPNLAKTLQGALRQWYFQMIAHHVPCHLP